jgi:poly(hydroxyalkanoate) depolymerase family esterase
METEMAEATRLTRMGQLLDATALIQRTLGQGPRDEASITVPTGKEPIDVDFRVVESGAHDTHIRGSMAMLAGAAVSPFPAEPTSAKLTDTASLSLNPYSRAKSKIGATRAQSAKAGSANTEIWAGGQFIDESFTNKAGTRAYKLYVPKGYRGQALPLVVMLHGCTQNPDDFAAGTRMNVLAEREQFLVVYPAQTTSSNPSKCWKWFNANDQQRERGEPSIIAGITRKVLSTYHCDTHGVYVAGMSAGGAMAVIMGVLYPDLYTGIGVHSGLPYGAAVDLPSALAAMRNGRAGTNGSRLAAAGIPARAVPTIVFHGDQDTTVHPRNGDHVVAQSAARGAETTLRKTVKRATSANGRGYTHSIYHDISGHPLLEQWLIHGAGHAWSGGSPKGSFTDQKGPDASQEMIRFFSNSRIAER